MSDADENDLFNIQVSDSEDDKVEKKSRRTGQTEDEFQAVKNTYRAKVENGNIQQTITLPLEPGANKQHVQEVLHAAEELYFFRRYQEVVDLVSRVLTPEGDKGGLDEETRQILSMYQSRCRQKMKQND
ncbi:uncharacterized protein TrAtP1_006970 [Trichoderma atroviride]|uniref:Uncharacterized protein n=1 Tax=Hypocrea atroviridis (strain ATCC 20476 / IMI 206040) TaxID=452589 RepID=G9PCH2_HYPAI|nr:uncharacterized protein TRIATDRAFT_48829 [Trichoderma atroviride IMI 206040]EHK39546.1 hypothetical protein TRIATDRAFT_48829 [Trichoderma atroviride IMI 206040]UKZ65778.1 hypothetical protein TrAtP1_006970 [Trichoderma atroviride]